MDDFLLEAEVKIRLRNKAEKGAQDDSGDEKPAKKKLKPDDDDVTDDKFKNDDSPDDEDIDDSEDDEDQDEDGDGNDPENTDAEEGADDLEDSSETLPHVKTGGKTKVILNPEQDHVDRHKYHDRDAGQVTGSQTPLNRAIPPGGKI